jgi:hypothetical protein
MPRVRRAEQEDVLRMSIVTIDRIAASGVAGSCILERAAAIGVAPVGVA